MRKYTILHTIETAGPGGAETVLLNLAAHLDRNRFRSLVLLPEDRWLRKKLQERGIPTFLAKSSAWHDLQMPRAMARLIRGEKVDLIHSHLSGQNFYSCLVGRLLGCKIIATYHGSPQLYYSNGLRGAIQLRLVRHSATAVVAVSDYIEKLLKEMGFRSDKIVRIHNGIDMERFSIAGDGELRREVGCPAGAPLIGMIANLRVAKAHEYFIRAARQVVDVIPQARFVAVGEVDRQIGKRLSSLIDELRLQQNFSFLGFREDVPGILRALDVFVLSSVNEGFSLATLEAMAAGTPVVATRSGGPEEIVEDGSTGFLVPRADPRALAEKICQLVSNQELARTLGRRARAAVGERFTLNRMVSDCERLYERCLNVG